MTITLITHAIALLLGGAGGYLWGAKVRATAAAVTTDIKKL